VSDPPTCAALQLPAFQLQSSIAYNTATSVSVHNIYILYISVAVIQVGPLLYVDLNRRTEIVPGKHLTNGHGHYITVTPERTLFSVG
jgi:hypothetical protein